ncbi:TonB-dependent siderophore receptor [Candidimonas nitroreducens]|uniref:TonB-dependent siderophore receptor n=1 Tax=Candidimonas nitroreducens TaxID=683354 RepID=A0A225MZE1_9BURK|nr:TonB-dependent siderophore receptor [Candidimonas nitroreducens]
MAQGTPNVADASRAAAMLPAITVTGAPDEDVSATTKIPQSIKDTPQSITVIDQERMQEQNLRTLDDVMQQAPGITVQPYQQLTTAYYARGFKIDSFEEDGVPILMGNTASPPQDMSIYERVEILRGANGLLHGSGNPAATVNLVPKRPQKEFGASAAVSAGSWDRYRAEADVGGPLNASGSLRGRVVASQEDRGYFYDVGKQRSSNFYGIGELDLGSRTTLSAGIQYQRIRSVTNMAGVPFYSDGGDIGLPRSTYLDASWDSFDWDTTRMFGGLEHHFSNGWQSKILVNHLSSDAHLKYAGSNGAIDRTTGLGARLTGAAYRFENSQTSVDGYATGPFELFGRTHELLFGANFQNTETEQYTASFVPALNVPVNVFSWDPHSVPEPALSDYRSPGSTRIDQSGLYAMGRFSLADPLKLIVGARLSQWKQETPTATTKPDTQLTPYGGLVFALTPQWSVYASYAQVFQPQTQATWSGQALNPIEGTNLEAGIKGELAHGRLNVSLAAFDIRQRNRAQPDPAHPCVGQACYYITGGDVRSQGIEAEATGRLTPNLSVSASYTYNTTKYLKDATSEGQPFASFTPRHIARLWGNYTPAWNARRLSIGLDVLAQSDYSVQSGGTTLRQGGYALVNARIGYRISRRVTAAVNVNNLFDRTYYQSLSSPSWNNRYGEPRSLMLTLRAEY